ncbi:creatininase family protein [Nocardia takedensis]
MWITEATSTDIAARTPAVAVVPVGSFEQHGDHLPLITDTVIASLIAQRLAETYPLLLLPPVTLSCSHEHEGFPGTVSLSAATLTAIITDIQHSLARSGIHQLVLVNAHGGNYTLSNLAQQANTESRRILLYPGRGDWNQARAAAAMVSDGHDDMHAGELETSILLHATPDLVRPSYREADHAAPNREHLHLLGMTAYTSTGVIGHPSAASADKGAAALDALTTAFAAHYALFTGTADTHAGEGSIHRTSR